MRKVIIGAACAILPGSAVALCVTLPASASPPPPVSARYVIIAGTRGTVTCPPGMHATGGGASAWWQHGGGPGTPSALTETQPWWSGSDPFALPDGWQAASVPPPAHTAPSIEIFADCAR